MTRKKIHLHAQFMESKEVEIIKPKYFWVSFFTLVYFWNSVGFIHPHTNTQHFIDMQIYPSHSYEDIRG